MTLSIIILSYNTKDLLAQTIRAVNTTHSHEIIVVDNGSTDGTLEYLDSQPHITTLKLKQNTGFATGNNQGIKIAKGKYILLLNSDTKIIGAAIDKSLKYMRTRPRVGILTPALKLPDGSIDLACHRGFPTVFSSLTYFLKLEQLFPNSKITGRYHQTYKDFETTHKVDVVSGAAMFIRREVIDQIGLLDERFFMYAEDIDFCKRARQAGWDIVYYPKATVVHFKGSSGTTHTDPAVKSKTKHHFYQTMKQYFDKHSPGSNRLTKFLVHTGIDLIAKIRK